MKPNVQRVVSVTQHFVQRRVNVDSIVVLGYSTITLLVMSDRETQCAGALQNH